MHEIINERNMTVEYHGGQLYLLPKLFQCTKMTWNHLVDKLLIGNKRDTKPILFCLLVSMSDMYRKRGLIILDIMKVFTKVTKKHGGEYNCWIDRRRYWIIRDTTITWDKIIEKNIYEFFSSNRTVSVNCHCQFFFLEWEMLDQLKDSWIFFVAVFLNSILDITNK